MYALRNFECQKFVIQLVSKVIKDTTCYKNPENPRRIDLILANNLRSFQNSCVIKTCFSNFHVMVTTIIKTPFEWLKPRLINYRDFKSFANKIFWERLFYELSNARFEENANGFEEFFDICKKTLNHNAPIKQKYVRDSNLAFMNKTLWKVIMHRTRCHNKYLNNKTDKNRSLKTTKLLCLTNIRIKQRLS